MYFENSYTNKIYLKGGKPHEPVKSIMIWTYYTRSSVDVARLAKEVILEPLSLVSHVHTLGAFKYDFISYFGNADCNL